MLVYDNDLDLLINVNIIEQVNSINQSLCGENPVEMAGQLFGH